MNYNDIFDFGDLSSLTITAELEDLQLRFDNFLALTAYDDQRTLILTVTGQLLLLTKKLTDCLHQFCDRNRIRNCEMAAYYGLVDCRTQGLIAGNYRLVPSQGASNPHVVYYNAHFLDSKTFSKKRQRVLVTFKNQHGAIFQLYIDACYQSFVRILAAAEKVSAYQLRNLEEEMWRLGVTKEEAGSRAIFQHRQEVGRVNTQIQVDMIARVLTMAFENSYGQKPDEDFTRSIQAIVTRHPTGC